jgi:glycosyltransferase involved in cell wall biosynthesis
MEGRSRVLFLDHVGVLGGAELALVDVVLAYRETSTVLLFADGPFRERLVREGIRVEVIDGNKALQGVRRETRWPGVRASWQAMALAMRITRLARTHDFIHANSQKAFVIGCLAGALARRPVIWDLNDLLIPEHFSRTNIWFDVVLANHLAARVIANSQASAKALVAQGGRVDKVRVVYNGISSAPFDRVSDRELATVASELGLGRVPTIGVFGRLAEWKGQHIALKALAHIPRAHLLLVGDALFGEQRYATALRRQASDLGVADRVHFLGFRSDVPRLMRFVDIVLHTSTAPEPFGRVIVEGMLARRPVVATRAGGVEEIIRDGETGVMVSPGDHEALAAALRQLLDDPGRTAEIADAGRRDAEMRFTVDAMVNGMTRYMEEIVCSCAWSSSTTTTRPISRSASRAPSPSAIRTWKSSLWMMARRMDRWRSSIVIADASRCCARTTAAWCPP